MDDESSSQPVAGCHSPNIGWATGNQERTMDRKGWAGKGKGPQRSEGGGGAWHAVEGARGEPEPKSWQPEGGGSCREFLSSHEL